MKTLLVLISTQGFIMRFFRGKESGMAMIPVQKQNGNPAIIRCRDCKYFRWDAWARVNGIPLIAAHEMCMKWGGGCKTSPDGYCFMAERKEGKDEQADEKESRMAAL